MSEKVRFFSRFPGVHTICMEAPRREIIDGIPVAVTGRVIRFTSGEYTTDDPKEIAFLRGQLSKGDIFEEQSATAKTTAATISTSSEKVGAPVFKCELCERVFDSKMALVGHMKSHKE